MSIFPYKFDKHEKESFTIPEGIYKIKITQQKEIENSLKTASGIGITCTIMEGEQKEKIVYDNFYIEHPNKTFEKKEKNRLNAIGEALGLVELSNIYELNNKMLSAKVKVKKASTDGQFPEKNVIADYFPYNHTEGNEELTTFDTGITTERSANHIDIPF